MKSLSFISALFLLSPLFSQTSVETSGSVIYQFGQWGDNYVCNMLGGISVFANQKVALFDKTGKVLWEKELEVKGDNGRLVMSKSGEYVYLVDVSNTLKTIKKVEATTDLVTIYRLDKTGNVKTIHLPYAVNFGSILGNDFEYLKIEYLCSNSNGISGVVSKCVSSLEWSSRKYALFSVSNDGLTVVKQLEFDGTYSDWTSGIVSLPDFKKIGDTLVVINLKKKANQMEVKLSSYELTENILISEAINLVTLKAEYGHAHCHEMEILDEGVINQVEHTYIAGNSSVSYEYSTLGNSFNYQVDNGKFYFLGSFYSGLKTELFASKGNMVGYYYFEVDPLLDKEIETESINYVPFNRTLGAFNNYTLLFKDEKIYSAFASKEVAYFFVNDQHSGQFELGTDVSSSVVLACGMGKIYGVDGCPESISGSSKVVRVDDSFNVYQNKGFNERIIYEIRLAK